MRYEQTISISKNVADMINKYLYVEPESIDDCLGEDETIIYTAVFPDGFEIDIKCCGVQYDEREDTNTAWIEAVLFHNGYECYSEPADDFFGEWFFEYDGNEYVVNVVSE